MAEGNRDLTLSLTLGQGSEQLKPIRIDAHEGLSQPFRVTIDVIAQGTVPLLPNIGKPAAIDCRIDGRSMRKFHGLVIDASYVDEIKGTGFVYRLTLGPSSHFHEQSCKFRIFQNKTVLDIIKDILDECRIDYAVNGSPGTRDLPFCVQYGESDFGFVSRLMEEEGIYYYYHHQGSRHVLNLCDNPAAHNDLPAGTMTYNPGTDSVAIRDSDARAARRGTFLQTWLEFASSGGEGKIAMRDFDFINPARPVEVNQLGGKDHDEDEIEVYQWPGRYWVAGTGDTLAKTVLESRRAQRLRYEGRSRYTGIQAGFLFKLEKHPNGAYNGKKYLITDCRMQLADEQYRSGTLGSETLVEFTAIPHSVRFRAPIVTPRPTVRGPETAIVTGPPGEEIHVDKYGRIRIQFHWDREGQYNDQSTCWVRVSQYGALGSVDHPRVGEEVLVNFIGGNPDRPLVVGRVYNEANKPIYELPKHKTMTVLRSKTYKKDGFTEWPSSKPIKVDRDCVRNGSEIRIDDDTSNPQMFIYAEMNLDSRVSKDETHHVGGNQEVLVRGNRTEHVEGNETITIDQNRNEKVKQNETVEVTGNRDVTIKSNDTLMVTGTIDITSKQSITIKATTSITLQCGPSKIVMNPAGITVEGPMLNLKGGGTATLQSPMTTVKADAMLTVSGGFVKIN